ncbi:GNAT family N-acetyltransferase [Octadecabacter sp.]|nr:GNAT family N-acetyltransferase [Octadecabacter sp.]
MQLRDGVDGDAEAVAGVFFRAVREGALGPYTQAECAAWCGERPSATQWIRRTEGLETVVAEMDGQIVGFMTARASDGYIDHAFVLPEMRGQGVADAIYAVVENRARCQKTKRLHTHASHMAKSFFSRHGWIVVSENQVDLAGVQLTNWIMDKPLS